MAAVAHTQDCMPHTQAPLLCLLTTHSLLTIEMTAVFSSSSILVTEVVVAWRRKAIDLLAWLLGCL